jgi:hypothetical protein
MRFVENIQVQFEESVADIVVSLIEASVVELELELELAVSVSSVELVAEV